MKQVYPFIYCWNWPSVQAVQFSILSICFDIFQENKTKQKNSKTFAVNLSEKLSQIIRSDNLNSLQGKMMGWHPGYKLAHGRLIFLTLQIMVYGLDFCGSQASF